MKKILPPIILILFVFLIGLYQSAFSSSANELDPQGVSRVDKLNSLLLIVIDNLNNPEAQLLSIWQITINKLENEIKIIPVYPSTNRTINYKLKTSFDNSLDIDQNKDFVREISENELHWKYYILVDPNGLSELIEFASYANFGSSRIDKNSIRELLVNNAQDPETAYQTQLHLFRQVCLSPITGIFSTSIQKLFTVVDAKTNLYPSSNPSNWEDLSQLETSLICKFYSSDP